MTNLQAALGLGQLERINQTITKREKLEELIPNILMAYLT